MKKPLLSLALTCLLSLGATQLKAIDIPNPGFETWADDGFGNLNPQGWETMNDGSIVSTSRSNSGHGGNYAMTVRPVDVGGYVAPGIATMDFAFDQRPTQFRAWLKANMPSGQSAFVYVILYHQGSIIASPGDCSFKVIVVYNTYTLITIPITYQNLETPDSATIMVVSGDLTSADTNASVTLDDLEFQFGTTNTANLNAGDMLLYPNPAHDFAVLKCDFTLSPEGIIEISDLNGKLVFKKEIGTIAPGKQEIEVDLRNLDGGIYILRIKTQGSILSQKLQILR